MSWDGSRAAGRRRIGLAIKRGVDIAGACVGLLLLSPVLASAALAIGAFDGRPVLFWSERPGFGEHPFRMYKFRTMRAPKPGESWLMGDGRRVTRLGRVLRSASVDELPQLWNVLRGDMSLVGPRPLLTAHLAAYTPEERRRHDMRPGFTGWAAVNGRHTSTFEERLRLDIWYVDHWSLLLDLRIIAMTVVQVLGRTDASAIQDPALSQMPERFLAAERTVSFDPGTGSGRGTSEVTRPYGSERRRGGQGREPRQDPLVVGWTPNVPGLDRLRPLVFWTLDALRGGRVRAHLRDIEEILDSTPASTEARRQQRLAALLLHATGTVPLYRNCAGFHSLTAFPVVDKNILRDAQESALSGAYVGRRLHIARTSGSTGTPFSVKHDANKRARQMADIIYYGRAAGYEIGSRRYELRILSRMNTRSFVERLAQNVVQVEVSDLSDATLAGILEVWGQDPATKSVYSYSPTFEALGEYLGTLPPGPLDVGIRSIMAGGGALSQRAQGTLRRRLGCSLVVRYSNEENGFLAQQCLADTNEYHVNWASYYLELLAVDRDEPAQPGEIGRIVVTDLFNYAMPLIRYDTGDTGVLGERGACGWPLPVLRSIEGRRVDFLTDARGNLVSPFSVSNLMEKYTEPRQVQFAQVSPTEYRLTLNCPGGEFGRLPELVTDLKRYLGDEATITAEYVDQIPLLASGKYKEVSNLWRGAAASRVEQLVVSAAPDDDRAASESGTDHANADPAAQAPGSGSSRQR